MKMSFGHRKAPSKLSESVHQRLSKFAIAASACTLLVFTILGCGATNKLESIQLSTSNTSETTGSTLTLYGIGGTLQLYTWGNYSNGKHVLLGGSGLAYEISITPNSLELNDEGDYVPITSNPNATPPQTVQLTGTGLLTAVTPFTCTWTNTATPPASSPIFAVVGSYTITATFGAFTSPPAFVTVASAPGLYSATNPEALCTNLPSSP
jgi:hypothetical protein